MQHSTSLDTLHGALRGLERSILSTDGLRSRRPVILLVHVQICGPRHSPRLDAHTTRTTCTTSAGQLGLGPGRPNGETERERERVLLPERYSGGKTARSYLDAGQLKWIPNDLFGWGCVECLGSRGAGLRQRWPVNRYAEGKRAGSQ